MTKDAKKQESAIAEETTREGTPDVPEIKSEAPQGFRELRPGKSLVANRVWSSASFHFQGGVWKREKKKNRFVPDSVVKSLQLSDKEIKELFLNC